MAAMSIQRLTDPEGARKAWDDIEPQLLHEGWPTVTVSAADILAGILAA